MTESEFVDVEAIFGSTLIEFEGSIVDDVDGEGSVSNKFEIVSVLITSSSALMIA
jgi:hypothetical protein